MSLDRDLSLRIDLLRLLLICGVVVVHVPFDPQTSPFLAKNGAFDWLRVFLADALFRIGVPCLSVISGYLLFRRGLAGFRYGDTVRHKVRSLLVPFLIWNGALFLGVLGIQAAGMGDGYFPDISAASWTELGDLAFSIRGSPVNTPLYFLRDLFVCVLLSPLLAILARRLPVPTLLLLFVGTVLPDVEFHVVVRKSILLSFTLGIALALHRVDLRALDRHARPIIAVTVAAAALLATGLFLTGPDYPSWLQILRTLLVTFGMVGAWVASAQLIRSRLGQRLARTGSLSFWIFCAHGPLLTLLWMVWNRMGIDAYPAFFLGALPLALAILVVTNDWTRRRLPRVYGVLTGRGSPGAAMPGDLLVRST